MGMHKILIAFTLSMLTAASCAGSEASDVMMPIQQFADGFNKGDPKAAFAVCLDDIGIIDEVPPHEWHGAGASSKWLADFDADAKKNGITDTVVALHKPRHVDVTQDRAYVVVPADYTYKQNGKPMKEKNSILTIALQKTGAGWRIAAWTWAKR